MERKNHPLSQAKFWYELTEKEQQIIRDSWEHTLSPEECWYYSGDLEYGDSDTILKCRINLCIRGSLSCYKCSIEGDMVVYGDIDSNELDITGNLFVNGDIHTADEDIRVLGDFIVNGDLKGCQDINVDGSFIVHGNVDCYDINVLKKVTIDGNVKCSEFNAGENITIGVNVDCTWDVFTAANLVVKGNIINCDDIDVFGNFEINGNLNCNDVKIQGSFTHSGKIKCHSLEVQCKIPE